MGEVFLVEHEQLGRQLVAKLLHRRLAGDEQLLDRVRLEAQSLALLRDPNVVEVIDFRVTPDGLPFVVMEYLIGRTLKDELGARGSLSLLDALDFADQALSGLGAAHSLGIVHRDVKPDNLFLSEEPDGTITLKVIDFGIARVMPGVSALGPQPLAVPTETGAVLGTPRYLSPEAALGRRGVDHRADLYALALVLYEMVAGRGPFEHLKHDFLTAHSVEDPLPPSHYAKRPIPPELDAVILRGLCKDPEERYQTVKEFQLELERLWKLLTNSQGLETTVFAPAERSDFRTTGQLRRQAVPAQHGTPAAAESGDPLSPDSRSNAASRIRTRPALLVASVLVGLITAIAVTGAVVALMARFAP
jgi:eukaryotic-like serine/threonine-protein kinase